MSLISCPECGKEVSDKAQSCPNCGCPLHGTQEMNAEMHRAGTAGMPLNQQQSASQVKPKKKGRGCLIAVLIVAFFMICGIVGATASRANKETAGSTNAEVVEDVQQFSGISVEALKEIMGDPVAEEEWTNSTSKGEFPVTTLQYEKNSNHYEFIIAEDAVVRLSIYSNQYWNGTGDLFSYSGDKENILKMFNVDAGESARIETDNGVSYVLVSVNDAIAEFNVQDIDANAENFGFVKITYNANYFD